MMDIRFIQQFLPEHILAFLQKFRPKAEYLAVACDVAVRVDRQPVILGHEVQDIVAAHVLQEFLKRKRFVLPIGKLSPCPLIRFRIEPNTGRGKRLVRRYRDFPKALLHGFLGRITAMKLRNSQKQFFEFALEAGSWLADRIPVEPHLLPLNCQTLSIVSPLHAKHSIGG
jgi:hypothetical protein